MDEGSREWFAGQVVQNQKALFRTARAILHSDEDAEDAVQDAIVSAYAALETLRDRARFKPWILRILTNQCYELCRKSRPGVELSEVEALLPAPGTDPAERLSLWQAIRCLPEDLRIPIVLFYYEDLTVRQIGEVLSLTIPAVKTRLHRGRGRLRQLLDEEGEAHGSV